MCVSSMCASSNSHAPGLLRPQGLLHYNFHYIAEISETSILEHGAFCIVLSGGSLISLMGKLIEPPYNKIVDWAKWYVFWAEERAEGKTHDNRNYKLAKDNLLSKVRCVWIGFLIA
ncbi:hypothetical protein Bca4012_037986 [Brassica carinata]